MSFPSRYPAWCSLRCCVLALAFAAHAFAQTETVVTSIVPPASRTYQWGQPIDFFVRFSAPVVVVPPASIRFVMGSGEVVLNYFEGSGSTTLRFSTSVGSGYNDYDGVELVGPIATPNGGSIRDLAGRAANLNFARYHATGVRIDTPATVSAIWLHDPTSNVTSAARVVFRVFFNEPVFDVTPAAFALTVSGTLRGRVASVSASSGTVFDVAVETEGDGSVRLEFPGNGQVRDAGGSPASRHVADGPYYFINRGPRLQGTTVRATAGQSFTYRFVAEAAPTRYEALNLPPGLTLDAANGSVTGVPTVAGRYPVEVTATRENQGGMTTFYFEILEPGAAPPSSTGDGRTPQGIWFRAPAGGVRVGETIALNGNATSGLPLSYTITAGDATIAGATLTPRSGRTLVVRATQAGDGTFAPESIDVHFGNPGRLGQTIDFSTLPDREASSMEIALAARASSGLPVTYSVSGPATLEGAVLRLTGTGGEVTVRAQQGGNDIYLPAADVIRTFRVTESSARLVNLSSRTQLGSGTQGRGLVAGFVIAGTGTRTLLARAVGPTLAQLGVAEAARNPRLELRSAAGATFATNEGWQGSGEIAAAAQRSGAFALAPASRDAALLVTLSPGPYTAEMAAPDGGGIGLFELYDATLPGAPGAAQLANLSARGFVGDGDGVLITGFGLTSGRPRRVLVRGVGPALRTFGVNEALEDPVVRLYRGDTLIAENDDWETSRSIAGGATAASATEVTRVSAGAGAFALATGSRDAALVVELPAGSYTVVLAGAGAGRGTGLIEVYAVE